jgi:hypothetical protein
MTMADAPADTEPCYVFAVVDGDLPDDAVRPDAGIAQDLRLLRAGPLAAVVGTLAPGQALGRAADLRAHDRVVAALVASGVTVLPLRFGAVVADADTVVTDLLTGHAAELIAGLDRVRGCVQFTITATYELDVVLGRLMDERPDLVTLRERAASVSDQVRLGEQVVAALAQSRTADAPPLLERLAAVATALRSADPATPETVLQAAALVRSERADRFVSAVQGCGRRYRDRLRIRLVGPVAPYDFVPER